MRMIVFLVVLLAVSVSADRVVQANLRRALREGQATKTLVVQSGSSNWTSGSSSNSNSNSGNNACGFQVPNITTIYNQANAAAVGSVYQLLNGAELVLNATGVTAAANLLVGLLPTAITQLVAGLAGELGQLLGQICTGCISVARALINWFYSLGPEIQGLLAELLDLTGGAWTGICSAIVGLLPTAITSLIPQGLNLCDASLTSFIPAGCVTELGNVLTELTPNELCDVSGFWYCNLLPGVNY